MEVLHLKRNDEDSVTSVVVSIFSSQKKADELTARMNKNMLNRSRYIKKRLMQQKYIKKK